MGALLYLIYPWGFILQGLAIVHFIRRRPNTFWIWIILFGGGLGALVYLVMEAAPDVSLLRQSFKFFLHYLPMSMCQSFLWKPKNLRSHLRHGPSGRGKRFSLLRWAGVGAGADESAKSRTQTASAW